MHWRIKGLMQKTLGVLPGGDALHYRLQRRFGGLRDFRRELGVKIEDWTIMAGHLQAAGLRLQGSRLVEIGTGWYPTFPFACFIAGAARIDTFDLTRHLKPELLLGCARAMPGFAPVIAQAAGTDPDVALARAMRLHEAIQAGADLATASDGAIAYHAPADAAATGLPAGSVDAVFSNSVLEHVAPAVLQPLYREALRILRTGGLMFHSVNCGDHYAYADRNIHQLHYLRYSDRQWRLWDNRFLYQNRLRANAFVDGARQAGFELVLDTSTTRPERLAQLRAMRVHPQFAAVPEEILCITSVDFIGRRPG